ncbi:hypothetical protein FNV43_RR07419 [Rhamnella rubrinervis]|uniref:Uncharacterized protein n=1 Tax=Rhamnella rubrinervis TaxID=2594499 RepID=A0A8K0MMD9_9ROSA|nr:hypothetical protein FNV43_RR07419 [Rhamnella rubrinervis]
MVRSDYPMVEYDGFDRWISRSNHPMERSGKSDQIRRSDMVHRSYPRRSDLPDLSIGRSDREIQRSDLVGSTIFDHRTVGSTIRWSDPTIQWSDLVGSALSNHEMVDYYYPAVGSSRLLFSVEYANYKTKVICVRPWCSKSESEDEVYKCLDVDRNAYNMKMKFLYGRASQVVELVEIRHEKDVRAFILEVRHSPVQPLLYVELIPTSPQLSKGEHENIACTSRRGFSKGDHQSYASPSIPPSNDFYNIEVPESQTQFNVDETVDIGGNQSAGFRYQDEQGQLHNMDNYANDNITDYNFANDNDVFGDAGCDDIADDDGVIFGNTA